MIVEILEVGFQGVPGAIDPADRARFDRAVDVAETIDARVERAEAADRRASEAQKVAEEAAGVAVGAAATAAGEAAAAIAPAAADAIRAQVAADADRAEQATAANISNTAAIRSTVAATAGIDNSEVQDDPPFALIDADGNILHQITPEFVTEFYGGVKIDPRVHDAPFVLTDNAGNALFRINADFETEFYGGSRLDGRQYDWPISWTDEAGNIICGYKDGAWHFAGGTGGGDLDRLDRRNRDRSIAILTRPRVGVQMPVTETSLIVMTGQSLSKGQETWPSLSKQPVPGALMMGGNVDPTTTSASYGIVGSMQLNPLVAHTRSGSANLTGEQEAALAVGSSNFGEVPVIGLVNALKRSLNRRALAVNDGRSLIALNAGVSGKTIEDLSKVSADGVNRYALVTDGLTKAAGLSQHAVVPVVGFAQGEYNYPTTYGGDTTRAGYRAKLAAYFNDVATDILASLPDQTEPPLIVTYQTGANYTVDLDANGQPGLAIGMAQLDLARTDPRVVMAGPAYPYTDKGGHLDSNGSRWMGHHFAKAVLAVWQGGNFEPTRPLQIVAKGTEVFLHYHVPVPPLVFDTPYQILTPAEFAAKGYRVTSANGATAYGISAVEVVRPTIIKLTLNSSPPADALVWYAAKSGTNGNGCVRDSDPAVASDLYEFVPERGMYASANIPALVGKPYPLHNWSVAFCLPISYSEF